MDGGAGAWSDALRELGRAVGWLGCENRPRASALGYQAMSFRARLGHFSLSCHRSSKNPAASILPTYMAVSPVLANGDEGDCRPKWLTGGCGARD